MSQHRTKYRFISNNTDYIKNPQYRTTTRIHWRVTDHSHSIQRHDKELHLRAHSIMANSRVYHRFGIKKI